MHRTTAALGLSLLAFTLVTSSAAFAEPAAPLEALAKMPVKEITIFKDGHALVLHAGKMPTDKNGDVLMDYLPHPVLGTFWPYSAEKDAKLVSTVASSRKVSLERTALHPRELIEANVGAEVIVTEAPVGEKPVSYHATILSVPAQTGEELEKTSPPTAGPLLGQKGSVVMFKTSEGRRAVNFERILDVTFRNEHKTKLAQEQFRHLLTLNLQWPDNKPRPQVDVGMMYVQRGVRWIPNYKVTLDGKGSATVQLQATLLNELTDLEDVTAHLVIGVPSFAFKDTTDPMSLQQQIAALSQYFQEDVRIGNNFSNAIMTQGQRMMEQRGGNVPPGGQPIDLGPEVASSGKTEDLFIFKVDHITLKKGQRMVIPVTEFKLDYRDVYTLDVPFTPPPEVWRNFDNARQGEIARLLAAPKTIHKVRLSNKSRFPLTTAPALVAMGDRVISQGMMTYTAPGAETDLELTQAVDVRVKKKERETARRPNAQAWQGDQYMRVDLEGTISLTNFGTKPVEIEVNRQVLGNLDQAGDGGKTESINVFEQAETMPGTQYPHWWGWYNWPNWWRHFNGVGKATWTVKLDPGKSAELKYTWHYYWR